MFPCLARLTTPVAVDSEGLTPGYEAVSRVRLLFDQHARQRGAARPAPRDDPPRAHPARRRDGYAPGARLDALSCRNLRRDDAPALIRHDRGELAKLAARQAQPAPLSLRAIVVGGLAGATPSAGIRGTGRMHSTSRAIP